MLNRALGLTLAMAVAITAAVGVAFAPAAPTARAQTPAASTAASDNAVLNWYRYTGREINQAAQMRNQPQRARLEMAMVQGTTP